jgi:hypothetical protein
MQLKKRLAKLEATISKTYLDPSVDIELTNWLESHPDYSPFAQPECNDSVVMPEHLEEAFKRRMNKLFSEKNLTPTGCNLLKIYTDLFK